MLMVKSHRAEKESSSPFFHLLEEGRPNSLCLRILPPGGGCVLGCKTGSLDRVKRLPPPQLVRRHSPGVLCRITGCSEGPTLPALTHKVKLK